MSAPGKLSFSWVSLGLRADLSPSERSSHLPSCTDACIGPFLAVSNDFGAGPPNIEITPPNATKAPASEGQIEVQQARDEAKVSQRRLERGAAASFTTTGFARMPFFDLMESLCDAGEPSLRFLCRSSRLPWRTHSLSASLPHRHQPRRRASSTSPLTSLFTSLHPFSLMQGATVHTFNATDSPQSKGAQTLSNAKAALAPVDMSALPSLRGPEVKEFKAAGGMGMASDVGTKPSLGPTTSPTEVAKLDKDRKENELVEVEKLPPGEMPVGPTGSKLREIPDWFNIGWTSMDRTLFLTPEEQLKNSVLADFVSQSYYGEWWHNAGIIVFAVISTHFVTLFGGGWGWLIIILAFAATYYQTSIARARRNIRDDMTREVSKKGLKSDVESAMWLNLFMTRFWLIYEPVLSATIVASVDQVLSVSTPGFLDSIRMTTFTLGTKPPRIDHVRTFPDTDDDVVLMDWSISFVPNDILDMTARAAAKKVNPKITIAISIRIGPAVVTKDIHVEDISFQGVMRIKLKLMNNFPHVQLVDMSFVAPPSIDFVPRPIGFDMSIIPGFKPFVMGQIHGALGPMMYDPNIFTLNLEQMLSGVPADTACGVLALRIHNGRGLKATKLGGGAPDPYISISIAGRAELAKTGIKLSTSAPHWNETKFILLQNLNETLTMVVRDWNEHRPDSDLGTANFDLKSLVEDGQQEGVTTEVMLDGKSRGQIKFDAIYCPVLKPKKLADGTEEPIPDSKTGVVRLTVHAAKDIDPRGQQINPYFDLLLNDKKIAQSQTLKRTPNPIWERPNEFLVTEKSTAVVGVSIMDDNSLVSNSPLGHVRIKLTDLLDVANKDQDWFPLSNAKSGRVRITAQWNPVLMAGAVNGAGAYTPPIGVIRIWFKKATDLKNVEALSGGKSDPYARILSNGIVVARTRFIDNDLNPAWDEFVYVEIHSIKDAYTLEVMDYQHNGKDRSLGVTDFKVNDLLTEGTDKKLKPWLSTGKKVRREALKIDRKKTVKGSVDFEVEFFPCAHLKNVSFTEPVSNAIEEEEEDEEEVQPAANGANGANGVNGVNGTAGSPTSSTKPKKLEEDPNEGIVIPREELMKTHSTEPARSPHAVWDEIGESFIRELDYSQIILKLNMAEKETHEDIVASKTIDMNEFLEAALDKPATFILGEGSARNTVTIAAKYIPVDIVLEPRESVNNSGHLRVELLDGKGIPAADRSGKSDPYAVFELNGEKVYKSEVVKKTLTPVWNEVFDMGVNSRVASDFVVTVYDWDRVGSATPLGKGRIDLTALEPFTQSEVAVVLTPIEGKPGKEPGTIRIKMTFKPAFLVRTRQATSTFGGAGRVGTSLAGGVVGGVGAVGGGLLGVGGAVGKGVFSGIRKVGGGGHHDRNGSGSGSGGAEIPPPVPPLPAYAVDSSSVPSSPNPQNHVRESSAPLSNGSAAQASFGGGPGLLSITIHALTGAGDEDEKKVIMVKHNGKTVESTHAQKGDPATFEEAVTVKTLEGPCLLEFAVVHKKAFGKDIVLADGSLNVWDHISALTSPTTSVSVPLTQGEIAITLSWSASHSFPASDTRSIAGSVSPSTRKSRFSGSRLSSFSPKASKDVPE
ncbi:hypothetical protein P7C70_g6053, partial [Phenoliferia sp. Uapishka_3]